MISGIDQARRYFGNVPGAVSGQGGHSTTFRAAMLVVQDFALSDADALDLLQEWNATCDPRWCESDLRHKIQDARRKLDPSKLGCKLSGLDRPGVPSTPLARLAYERGRSIEALRAIGGRDGERGEVHFKMWLPGNPQHGYRRRRGDNKPFGGGQKALTGKGGYNGLMGIAPATMDGDILVTEGEMDGAAGVDCGWPGPVLATPGAKPGTRVDEALQRICAGRTVYLAPDPDQDNDDARAWRTRITNNLIGVGCRVFIIPAVNDLDLDKRLKKASDQREELARLKETALPWENVRPQEGEAKPANCRLELTDLGNAGRFKRQHGERVLYNPAAGWRVWDGRRWKLDTSGEVHRLAHATARSIFEEAAATGNPHEAQKTGQWAIKSQSRDRLRAMVDVAQHLMTVDPKLFDADPWLFNCLNGTINLKTGELLRHRREDFITRLAPVQYDPAATHPMFELVLNQAMPDEALRRYAQTLFGITMIGEQVDDLFVLMYGPGGTSKTTMVEPFKKLMGDYAATVEPESLMVTGRGNGGGARGDIARLDGVRLALTTEVEDGAKLAVGLVKRLSGGDTITARRLHKEEFEFIPHFTLWIVSNHRPKADSADDGLWRRVRVLPFDRIIPEAQRDPKVKRTMLTDCLPAFLRWAVDGVRLYLDEGLRPPEVVKAAITDYRDSQDPLKDFLDACCIIGQQARIDNGALRNAYLEFCEEEGFRYPLGPKAFGERLRAMGFRQFRSRDTRGWEGLTLGSVTDVTDSSVTFSDNLSYGKVSDSSVTSVTSVTTSQAHALLDRLAQRGVGVRLDEAGRVNVIGKLEAHEQQELVRCNWALKAILAQDNSPPP